MAPSIAFGVLSLASPRSPHHQRLPSISRKNEGCATPTRRFWMKEYVSSMLASETSMCIAVVLVFCTLVALLSFQETSNSTTATALGKRSWKDLEQQRAQALEQQLMKKEHELAALELALRQQAAARARVEGNMHAQEGLIQAFQQRYENEKAEKLRAIHSLGVMAQSMDECLGINHRVRQEAAECRERQGPNA